MVYALSVIQRTGFVNTIGLKVRVNMPYAIAYPQRSRFSSGWLAYLIIEIFVRFASLCHSV
jgi:hypothetical protein